jgi:hypothetical protein
MNKILITLIFIGADDWDRPVFKHIHSNIYFGSTDILIPNKELGLISEKSIVSYFNENIKQIEYFGSQFNCEPHGGPIDEKYELVIITKEEAKKRRALLDKNIKGLETHTYAPELNKLVLNNTAEYKVNGITNLKEAVNYVFRSVRWEQLKLNLK